MSDAWGMKRRTRWNEKQAREVLAEADASGMTDQEFARRRGIPASRLKRWKAKLSWPSARGTTPRFAEVVGRGARQGTGLAESRVEVILANGRRVLLPPDVQPDRLSALLQALETPGC